MALEEVEKFLVPGSVLVIEEHEEFRIAGRDRFPIGGTPARFHVLHDVLAAGSGDHGRGNSELAGGEGLVLAGIVEEDARAALARNLALDVGEILLPAGDELFRLCILAEDLAELLHVAEEQVHGGGGA